MVSMKRFLLFLTFAGAVLIVVATGWLLLLVWCWRTGKLTDVEDVKREMLAKEEEYDERGE